MTHIKPLGLRNDEQKKKRHFERNSLVSSYANCHTFLLSEEDEMTFFFLCVFCTKFRHQGH